MQWQFFDGERIPIDQPLLVFVTELLACVGKYILRVYPIANQKAFQSICNIVQSKSSCSLAALLS